MDVAGAIDLPFLDPTFKKHSPALLQAARALHGPVVRFRLPASHGLAWLVLDHGLARELLRDARLVKSRPASLALDHPVPAAHPLFRHLVVMDPPQHTHLRTVMTCGLALRSQADLLSTIDAICSDLIAGLQASGLSTIDIAGDFAMPMAQGVIAAIIGIPAAESHLIGQWSEALLDADLRDPGDPGAADRIADDIVEYFDRLAASRDLLPAGCFFNHTLDLMHDGALTREECYAMTFLMVTAGFETTAHLLSSAVFLLLQHVPLWRALPEQDGLAAAAVEECLRLCPPLELSTPRFAREPLRVGDRHIAAGELLFIAIGAINRDPAMFEQPDRFQIARPNARRILSFGSGMHACLGAALARLQATTGILRLARAFPLMRLTLDPMQVTWKPGMVMRGLDRLPVECGACGAQNDFRARV